MWLALAGCGDLRIHDRPVDDLVLAREFVVHTPEEPELDVVCTSPDDPDEDHELHFGRDRRHEFDLFGLLADTDYDCRFTAGPEAATVSFRTDPLPPGFPTWETPVPSDAGDYVLFNEGFQPSVDKHEPRLMIVDRLGRLRWYYEIPNGDATDVDATYEGDGHVLFGGGYAVAPTLIDLAGEELAVAGPASSGRAYNHEVRRLPTGEVAAIALDDVDDGVHQWTGFVIDVLAPDLGSVDWSWRSQRGVDDGWLPFYDWPDPYHANAVTIEGDDVYVNLRSLGFLAKLSRATGALEWTLGPNRDFALLDADGQPADASDWFYMPHDPEKDGDDWLFHDNGVHRPGGDSPRVVELAVDQDARTATVGWQWTEPGWYEPIWGDADRLPDGHVLITKGHCDDCDGGTPGAKTELLEVDPTTDEVVWRLIFDDRDLGAYRAQRIDGCAIFANRRGCP
jgi:hypothetical protein